MKLRFLILLLLMNLAVLAGLVYIQPVPGYMDAEYYFSGAIRLFEGAGFTEEILWNYLDDPAGLPHPSHTYWMPLVSLLSAAGMWLTGSESYLAGRLVILCLALCLPLLVAYWSYHIHRQQGRAMVSGFLAIFGAFYLPFITHTDSFALVMVLGLGYFVCLENLAKPQLPIRMALLAGCLGVLSGLMHLSRADGLLWLAVAMLFLVWQSIKERRRQPVSLAALTIAATLLGYLLIMSPWYWRNTQLFGTPLAPGNFQTLWLNSYDELYIYPAHDLTPQRWLASGFKKILQDRVEAFGLNLQTMIAVQGQIFLFPLILSGIWSFRKRPFIQAAIVIWILLFFTMTIIFPFAGARGGFFHSGAALQPVLWVAAPLGLDRVLDWAARLRGWCVEQARRVFQPAMLGLAILLSLLVVVGNPANQRQGVLGWGGKSQAYQQVEAAIRSSGATDQDLVIVNNPPGYYLANRRPAIAIPYGDVAVVLDVARRYQASFLLLEFNQLLGIVDLYQNPLALPQFTYLGKVGQIQVFKIVPQEYDK